MNFDTYLNTAWDDHVNHSPRVAIEFHKGLELAETAEHLTQLIALVTHVTGEHLGEYKKGVEVLQKITTHSAFLKNSETDKALLRSTAALRIAGDENVDLKSFTLSDQIRILAVASSASADRNSAKAQELLMKAMQLSESGLDAKDPAYRSLAVTGNNLASALEDKTNRTHEQTELMLFAAQTARKYWEIAGTWNQVGYAEYRLAMSNLKAQNLSKAQEHAQKTLNIFIENKARDMDHFYGNQIMALVTKSQNYIEKTKQFFDKLSAEDKTWCEKDLKALE